MHEQAIASRNSRNKHLKVTLARDDDAPPQHILDIETLPEL